MGKHSCLGPVDPAFGSYRADAVIEEFANARRDIAANPNLDLLWQPILGKYPMTFLGECEKAKQVAEIVARKWLSEGMLAGVADKKDRESRINSIVSVFASHQNTKMHDRHISPFEAQSVGINIQLIEDNPTLQDLVMSVHHAATNYCRSEGVFSFHIKHQRAWIICSTAQW